MMIRKLAALALVAGVASGVTSVVSTSSEFSASAVTGGHITVGTSERILVGAEDEAHETKLEVGLSEAIKCTDAGYTAPVTEDKNTLTEVKVTPTYGNCYYGADELSKGHNKVEIRLNGCEYVLTVREPAEGAHSTVHLVCPTEKKIELEVYSVTNKICTVSIKPQTPSGGITYTTLTSSLKHAITLDVTVSGIHYERGGICAFLGSTGTNGSLTGSATATAHYVSSQVDLTAT